mgnify:CR=1 FL=1
MALYLKTEAKAYLPALEKASQLIDAFESPYGLELLSTVDWLLVQEHVAPEPDALLEGVRHWSEGDYAAQRKLRLFDRLRLELALDRLRQVPLQAPA